MLAQLVQDSPTMDHYCATLQNQILIWRIGYLRFDHFATTVSITALQQNGLLKVAQRRTTFIENDGFLLEGGEQRWLTGVSTAQHQRASVLIVAHFYSRGLQRVNFLDVTFNKVPHQFYGIKGFYGCFMFVLDLWLNPPPPEPPRPPRPRWFEIVKTMFLQV